MNIEREFPELKKLFRAGFERPHNFDSIEGKTLREWLYAASLPIELLKANAAVREAIHPAFPSGEAFGHLRHFYRRRKRKFSELAWLASFGYLPVARADVKDSFGHPWLKLTGARLVLDIEDPEMYGAFILWRLSVLADTTEDRKTPVAVARNRRIVH
jgi:hypothetical protein